MAEGLLRSLYGDRYKIYSAGTYPSQVNPNATRVMAEIGIDISSHHAKSVKEFLGEEIDYMVTVCDGAHLVCPFFPGGKEYMHKSFDDPSLFEGEPQDILNRFRRVRNEITGWIKQTFGKRD